MLIMAYVVSNLVAPLIIGNGALRQHRAVLRPAEHCIEFKGMRLSDGTTADISVSSLRSGSVPDAGTSACNVVALVAPNSVQRIQRTLTHCANADASPAQKVTVKRPTADAAAVRGAQSSPSAAQAPAPSRVAARSLTSASVSVAAQLGDYMAPSRLHGPAAPRRDPAILPPLDMATLIATGPLCALDGEQRARLLALLNAHRDCFGITDDDVGDVSPSLGYYTPVMQPAWRPARIPGRRRAAEDTEVLRIWAGKQVAAGLLEACPQSASVMQPTVATDVKKGKKRVCMAAMHVNKGLVDDHAPTVFIPELLQSFRGSVYFGSMDALGAYNNVVIHPDYRWLFAIELPAPYGIMQPTRLGFGTKCAPAVFNRMAETAFGDLAAAGATRYVDDMAPHTADFDDFIALLTAILRRGRHYGLTWKASKCMFGARAIDFVGFTVSAAGIAPLCRNLDYIEGLPTPRTVTEIRSLVGAVNFYGAHIHGLADITAPLNELLRKEAGSSPMELWSDRHDAAVAELRRALQACTVIAYPDPQLVFQLYTDASGYGIGAVLTQSPPDCAAGPDSNGVLPPYEKVVCFWSALFTRDEAKYGATVRELVAMVRSVRQFSTYLRYSSFTIWTDCIALLYLNRNLDLNPVLSRWAMTLADFDFVVKYLKGEHQPADACSRLLSSDLLDEARLACAAELPHLARRQASAFLNQRSVMRPATMAELCAGIGGAAEGADGYLRPVAAVEIDPRIAELYGARHPTATVIVGDVADPAVTAAVARAAAYAWVVGAPCQPFSSARVTTTRDSDIATDARAGIAPAVAQMAVAARPVLVIMENVPPFLNSDIYRTTRDILLTGGYDIGVYILDAAALGGHTIRRRLYLVAMLRQATSGTRLLLLQQFLQDAHCRQPSTVGKALASAPAHYVYMARTADGPCIHSASLPAPTLLGRILQRLPALYTARDGDSASARNAHALSFNDALAIQGVKPFDPEPQLPRALLGQIAANVILPLHMRALCKGLAAVGALDMPDEPFSGPGRIICGPHTAATVTDAARSARAGVAAARGCAVAATICPTDFNIGTDSNCDFNANTAAIIGVISGSSGSSNGGSGSSSSDGTSRISSNSNGGGSSGSMGDSSGSRDSTSNGAGSRSGGSVSRSGGSVSSTRDDLTNDTVLFPLLSRKSLCDAQAADAVGGALLRGLDHGSLSDDDATLGLTAEHLKSVYLDGDGVLMYHQRAVAAAPIARDRYGSELLVLPASMHTAALRALHDSPISGHYGFDTTLFRAALRFWWPTIKSDVRNWCNSCLVCQQFKVPHRGPSAPVGDPLVNAEELAATTLFIDLTGPYNTSEAGNNFVCHMVDAATRFSVKVAILDKSAPVVASAFLNSWVAVFGVPQRLHSDQGEEFTNQLLAHMLAVLGVRKTKTLPYRPQANAVVERSNAPLHFMMSTLAQRYPLHWDKYLWCHTIAANTAFHRSVGEQPFFLMFGRAAVLPIDAILGSASASPDEAAGKRQLMLQEAFELARLNADATRERRALANASLRSIATFAEGDQVWVACLPNASSITPAKLQPRYRGPHQVVRVLNRVAVEIRDSGSGRVSRVHVSRVRPYVARSPDAPDAGLIGDYSFMGRSLFDAHAAPTSGESLTGLPVEILERKRNHGRHTNTNWQYRVRYSGEPAPAPNAGWVTWTALVNDGLIDLVHTFERLANLPLSGNVALLV